MLGGCPKKGLAFALAHIYLFFFFTVFIFECSMDGGGLFLSFSLSFFFLNFGVVCMLDTFEFFCMQRDGKF